MKKDMPQIDINKANKHWIAVDDKTLMPSFFSCKGVGTSAIDEILQNRPYKNVKDLFWNEDGSWKHSKLNKKTMESLIKIRALDSLGIDEYFPSYKSFYDVVVSSWNMLRKRTKKRSWTIWFNANGCNA